MDINKLREYIKKSNFTVAASKTCHVDLLYHIMSGINYIEVNDLSNGFDPVALIRENRLSQILDEKPEDKVDKTSTHFLFNISSLGLDRRCYDNLKFYEDLRLISTLNNTKVIVVSHMYDSFGGFLEQKYSIKGGSRSVMVSDFCFYIDHRTQVKVYKNRFD